MGDAKSDPIFEDALSSFRSDDAKNVVHNEDFFWKWNATSIFLTTACLNHFIDHFPDSSTRLYIQNILQRFLKWYDSFWFFQSKPRYLIIGNNDPIQRARLILQKATSIA